MTKVYACLLGNWVCLNDDPECKFKDTNQSPDIWWKEGAKIYAPTNRNPRYKDSLCGLDYVNIFYKGKTYRINPTFIQIVHE